MNDKKLYQKFQGENFQGSSRNWSITGDRSKCLREYKLTVEIRRKTLKVDRYHHLRILSIPSTKLNLFTDTDTDTNRYAVFLL